MKKNNTINGLLAFLIVAVTILFIVRHFVGGGTAPTPAIFDAAISLEEAFERAASEGKVVFAVATADWCGPCQHYKRTTLVDSAVEEWIRTNAIAVYVDVDRDETSAAKMGVRSIPTTVLFRDGEVVARQTGVVGAKALLQWTAPYAIDSSSADTPAP